MCPYNIPWSAGLQKMFFWLGTQFENPKVAAKVRNPKNAKIAKKSYFVSLNIVIPCILATFKLALALGCQLVLAGSHIWLAAIFWLVAAFGLHQHLAGSCFWLAADFGWYTLFLAGNFYS